MRNLLKLPLLLLALIAAPAFAITITTASLPDGEQQVAYGPVTMTSSGAFGGVTWTIASGALPAGVTLSSGGVVSGTPSGFGAQSVIIRATDGQSNTTTKQFNFTIYQKLAITTGSLPNGEVGIAYNQTVNSSGGAGGPTWDIAAGGLPAGLSLSSSGVISGTPAAPGVSNFILRVSDAYASVTQGYAVTIYSAPVITTTSLPAGSVGSGYSQTLGVSGGSGGFAWSVISGATPPGVSLSAGGGLAGTPSSPGTYNFTARVQDGLGGADTQALSITIYSAPTILTGGLPDGEVGYFYNYPYTATGGSGGYVWSVISGMPAGLSLSAGGALSGVPSSAGVHSLTVQVTDSVGGTATRTLNCIIYNAIGVATFGTLPDAMVNRNYGLTFTANGGGGTLTWSVISGSLPFGLFLDGSGYLNGAPTGSGLFNFTVQVSDSAGGSATRDCTLQVWPELIQTTASTLPNGEVGVYYSRTFTATGGAGTFTWSVVSGAPPGLSLASNGQLTGFPAANGTYSAFIVRVSDGLFFTDKTYSLTILGNPSITNVALASGTVGSAYSQTLTATGGSGGYAYYIQSGTLPAGLTLSLGGSISGTPLHGGTSNVTFRVQDSLGGTGAKLLPITVIQPLAILNDALPDGVLGADYPATQLQGAGGAPAYAFSLVAGALPAGLSLSLTGQLTGKPTETGVFPVTFGITDALSATANKALAIVVNAPAGIATWTPLGAAGGVFRDLAVSPAYATDETLFAVSDAGELFRGTAMRSAGYAWTRTLVNPAAPAPSSARVLLSPSFDRNSNANAEARTVFVYGPDLGIHRSIDHGATFAAVHGGTLCGFSVCGASIPPITAFAIAPSYASSHLLWAVDSANRVYRSTATTPSWSLINNSLSAALPAGPLAVSPNYSVDQTLFLALGAQLHRSTNGGSSWSQVFTATDGSTNLVITGVVISPNAASDRTLLVETEGGRLFRSVDFGASFSDLTAATGVAGFHVGVIARSGQSPLFILERAAAQPFVYRLLVSEDYLSTVSARYAWGLSAGSGASRALVPTPALAGGVADFYYATEFGLSASLDDGYSFSGRDAGAWALTARGAAARGNFIVVPARGGWLRSTSGGASWFRLPPPSPANPDVLAAGLSPDFAADRVLFLADAGGLRRSADAGQSFTPVSGLAGPYAGMRLGFAPNFSGSAGVMFAGTRAGLFRSIDGGQSFNAVTFNVAACSAAADRSVLGLALSPDFSSDQTLFVASAVSGGNGGVCRSSDGGATWTRLLDAGAPFAGPVALSPVYSQNGVNGTPAKILMVNGRRSIDGGASWSVAAGTASLANPAGAVFSPAFATDGTVLLAGDGLRRSADFGATFAALGVGDALQTRRVTGLVPLPSFNGTQVSGSEAIAATATGVWRSTDGGRTFQALSTGAATIPADIRGAFVVPGGPQRLKDGGEQTAAVVAPGAILAATGDGIYHSDNGGVAFERLSAGLPFTPDTRAVTAPAADGAHPIAAVAGQGLWRYDGAQWQSLPTAATGTFVSFNEDANYLYAARENSFSLRSADGGLTWSSQDPTRTDIVSISGGGAGALRAAGRQPDVETAPIWSVSRQDGPLFSYNQGGQWTAAPGGNDYALPSGLAWNAVQALALDASTGGRIVLGGESGGVWRTRDGGDGWRRVDGTGSGLEATSRNAGVFLAAQTAYGTTDVLVGVIGSTTGGVYLSGDDGEHWTQINQGYDPNNLSISSLVKTSCAGCPVQYYSGSYGGGMYTRTVTVNKPPFHDTAASWCAGAGCACASATATLAVPGGTPFKICGSNFQAGMVVEFDGAPATGCTVTLPAPQSIACAAPPHATGAPARVVVRNPDTRAKALPSTAFTYAGGSSRALETLRVRKNGSDVQAGWSCSSCSAGSPARVYRAQNAAFTSYLEQFNGGASGTVGAGCTTWGGNTSCINQPGLATNPRSYFWTIE